MKRDGGWVTGVPAMGNEWNQDRRDADHRTPLHPTRHPTLSARNQMFEHRAIFTFDHFIPLHLNQPSLHVIWMCPQDGHNTEQQTHWNTSRVRHEPTEFNEWFIIKTAHYTKRKNNCSWNSVTEQITLVNDILGVLVFCMASTNPDTVTPFHLKFHLASNVNNVMWGWVRFGEGGWQSFIISDIYCQGFGEWKQTWVVRKQVSGTPLFNKVIRPSCGWNETMNQPAVTYDKLKTKHVRMWASFKWGPYNKAHVFNEIHG